MMTDPIYEGSSQGTSEEEESPVLSANIQKKPARRCLKRRKPIAVESDSAESQVVTSESDASTSEGKRIKLAAQAWKTRPPLSRSKPSASKPSAPTVDDESSMQGTSNSSDSEAETPKPASSGLLDYCSWMVDRLSPEERASAAANWWQTFAEFCAGMGTGTICFEGLRRAMARHDLKVEATCACMTEAVKWKAKALKELHDPLDAAIFAGCLNHQAPPCHIFTRTGDLNNTVVMKDFLDEVVVEKPTFHLLLQGIVCIDISGLSSTPRSVMDVAGESGQSLREMVEYLKNLSFADRPECIILECVLRLSQKRTKGLPQPEVGTELVTKELRTFGYVGSWETQDALKAYLPQSRKRTWGIYLKVRMCGDNPLDGEKKRREDVTRAFSIVKRLRVPKHEPLGNVLSRVDPEYGYGIINPKSDGETQGNPNTNMDWTKKRQFQKSMTRLGMERKDLLASEALTAFWKESGSDSLMTLNCRRHSLMKLASLKKNGKLPDWREEVLALNVDESAYRQGVGITHFTCVQPSRIHVLSLNGKLVKADGKVCLAMQGIQSKELDAFPSLSKRTSKQQQDLAGNAFTANICAACILAAAVVAG